MNPVSVMCGFPGLLLLLLSILIQFDQVTPALIHKSYAESVVGARWVKRSTSLKTGEECGKLCTSQSPSNSSIYVCGDPRLGPVQLPTKLPLSAVTASYDRFGGHCPEAFLKHWTAHGSYLYPPNDGFLTTNTSQPIVENVTLQVGSEIDRFGSESGKFASSARAPYAERSLPPSNLDTPLDENGKPGKYPFNYHLYQVKKIITVLAGPVAPWFSQPGMGTQFKFSDNITTLINQGYLKRINTS